MAARTGFIVMMMLMLALRKGMLEKLLYSTCCTEIVHMWAVLNLSHLDSQASTLYASPFKM